MGIRKSGTALAVLACGISIGVAPAAHARGTACPPQARADDAWRVDYRLGGISESVLRVAVPVSRVRGLIPRRYRLLDEASGTATLIVAHGAVESLSVDCEPARRATIAEYGVMIEAPDGSVGRHAYYLWQLSDDRRLVNRMNMLGVPARYATGTFATHEIPGGLAVRAVEEWDGDTALLQASAPEPAAGPLVSTPGVRFWSDGPRGTVKTVYECPDCRPRSASSGTVEGSPGSLLDSLLRGSANGSGFFIRASLVATATLSSR